MEGISAEAVFGVLGGYMWPFAFIYFSYLARCAAKRGEKGENVVGYFMVGLCWPVLMYLAMGLIPFLIVGFIFYMLFVLVTGKTIKDFE